MLLKKISLGLLLLWPLLLRSQPLSPDMQKHNDSLWNMALDNPPAAVPYGKDLLYRSLREKHPVWFADICARLSVAYDILGYKDSAAVFALRALPVYEHTGDLPDQAFVYNGLGLIYYSQKQYHKAIAWHRKSLQTELRRRNPEGVASSMINLGICYAYLDSTERTIRYYLQADSIYRANQMEELRPNALSNLLNLYIRMDNYREARRIMEQIKKLRVRQQPRPEEQISQLNLEATLLGKTGQPRAALRLYRQAATLAEQLQMKEKMQDSYNKLADTYATLQRYDSAYRYLHQSEQIGDSLYTVQLAAQVNELSLQYETEKKDRALAELRIKNLQDIQKQRLQAEELNEKKRHIYLLGLGIFIAAALLLMLAYIIIIRGRHNRLLQEKNRLVEENLQNREMLLGEIHHRVKNNLQLVVSILQLQARSLSDETVKNVFNDCIQRITTMGQIHRQLYSGDNPSALAIAPLCREIASAFETPGSEWQSALEIKTDIAPLYLPLQYAVPLGLIINELLTNSAKYAFEPGTRGLAGIRLQRENDELRLIVYDNGKGIDPGSQNRESFGFRLISSMARQISARWSTDYKEGTKHIFFIPFPA